MFFIQYRQDKCPAHAGSGGKFDFHCVEFSTGSVDGEFSIVIDPAKGFSLIGLTRIPTPACVDAICLDGSAFQRVNP